MPDDSRESLRVVAHLSDGSLVKGYLSGVGSFDPLSAGLTGNALPAEVTIEPESGNPRVINLKSAKALFFVKSHEGKSSYVELKFFERNPQIEGLWIKIRFRDGEITEGIVHNSLPFVADSGFFLRPPDPQSNNRVVYVVKSFLTDFRILGIRSDF
jgi:hypothetical protein